MMRSAFPIRWFVPGLLLAASSCGSEDRDGAGPPGYDPGSPVGAAGGSGACASAQLDCDGRCVDASSDTLNCGRCNNACMAGVECVAGACVAEGSTPPPSGSVNEGNIDPVLTPPNQMPGETPGETPVAGSCQAGSTATTWATSCQTELATTCVPGQFQSWGSSAPENYPLRYETEHFAFLWPDERNVSMAQAQAAGAFMEDVLWQNYLGSPIFWPEPDCNSAVKRKTSVHLIEGGLFGGCNQGRPGIWVGPGALGDHWGLAHEWMHSLQCMTPGFQDCGGAGCWISESHANFMPHQLPEYRQDVHCSEMLANMPHLYYGSTRDRYCNWQFFEFVKDKYCYSAVNEMWTATAPNGEREPWSKLARNMGWGTEQLNDAFGEWALHNITWDYQNPPPTAGDSQSATYRREYANITDTSRPERRRRLTALEPLGDDFATTRRFMSPYFWAPQRWGYNVVRLYPDAGATEVRVKFRGVTQDGAASGWRWSLVATDAALTTARYAPLQAGADGELSFCVNEGESLFLVVTGAPTELGRIVWDQPYPSIYRFPYLVELAGAWPEGFVGGAPAECASGRRHPNGGGCAPENLPASVFVGPYAQVLGGNVSGNARIEDHAIILNGATVSGGTVGALSILNRFNVSGNARVEATFYPPGYFEPNQGLSGNARLYGDVEYRGAGTNRNAGSFFGIVDANTPSANIDDVTVAPPYAWRD